jgi:hypothetical protein
VFEASGSKTIVDNAIQLEFAEFNPPVVAPPASAVVASLDQQLFKALATPPVVSSASAVVTASMPRAATLDGAAEVRAAQGDPTQMSTALVVDFQAQRTVAGLTAPANVTILTVAPWLGTKFDDPAHVEITPSGGGNTVTFNELQTERLLVTVDSKVTPAAFAKGSVMIPTPPSNLELLVNGTRAWFNAGPATESPYTVDIAAPVAAAAASGQDVVLTLRAATPAHLELKGQAALLKRYLVAFPEGAVRTVDASSEGVHPLSLPISTKAATDQSGKGPESWLVQSVVLDISAKIPPIRVQPPDGPTISTDAELVLDPDHALVVKLPPATTAGLSALTGVRLLVSVRATGAELAGTLRANKKVAVGADTRDEPADPLPKAALGPATLTAADAPGWIDLALKAPHRLAGSEIVWLELQVARGSIVWKLATPHTDANTNAELRRRTSSGTYVELSTLADTPGGYSGALRVVGQEKPNDPLAAVQVAVAGKTESVSGVPTQAGATMILGLTQPGVAPSPIGDDFDIPLELTISTPGSYAISAAELRYKQPSEG